MKKIPVSLALFIAAFVLLCAVGIIGHYVFAWW